MLCWGERCLGRREIPPPAAWISSKQETQGRHLLLHILSCRGLFFLPPGFFMCEVSVFLHPPCAFVEKLPFKRVPGPCLVRSLHTSLLVRCSASAAFLPCWGGERSRRVLTLNRGSAQLVPSARAALLRRSPLCVSARAGVRHSLPRWGGWSRPGSWPHQSGDGAGRVLCGIKAKGCLASSQGRAQQWLSQDPAASRGSARLPPPSAMSAALLPLSQCSPLCLPSGADSAGETP